MSELSQQVDAQHPTKGGPTALSERSLAPDLARGTMLLFIALANSHTFLHGGGELIRGYPVGGSMLDSFVAAILTVFVDGRSYTMFAALFGYGLVQILRRREAIGAEWPTARKLLRRRGRWMIVFGFAHAALLFIGDIIAAYGLIALVFVGALRWKDTKLLIWSGCYFVIGSALYGLAALPTPGSDETTMLFLADDPLIGALTRMVGSLVFAPFAALTAICSFLLGVWAARRRILEEPERHVVFLRRLAWIGIGVATLGGSPLALVTSGVIDPPAMGAMWGLGALHAATGYLGGPGYAAVIALLVVRMGTRTEGRFTVAIGAVGQRSMTCYLTQSVVWMVLFQPYTLGLGERIGVAATAGLAIVTWLLTVGMAEAMRRAGKRGPFEVLMRRLVYRKP